MNSRIVEFYIKNISSISNLSRTKILEKMYQKKRKHHYMITDIGVLHMMKKELELGSSTESIVTKETETLKFFHDKILINYQKKRKELTVEPLFIKQVVREYIKSKGCNTSSGLLDGHVLNDKILAILDNAVAKAKVDNRDTVEERDIEIEKKITEDQFPYLFPFYFLKLDEFKWEILKVLAQEKELTISQIVKKVTKLSNVDVEVYLEDLILRNLIQTEENDQTFYRYNLGYIYAKSLRDNILLELDKPIGDYNKSGFKNLQGALFLWNTERKQPEIPYEYSMEKTVRSSGCTNIFCYSGGIFPQDNVLVIGSRTLAEAISIIHEWIVCELNDPNDYLFCDELIYYIWENTFPDQKIHDFLVEDITENTEKGWCDTKEEEGSLQGRLNAHLELYKKLGDSMFDGPGEPDIRVYENEIPGENPYTDEELADIYEEFNAEDFTKPVEMVLDEEKVELLKFLSKKNRYSYFFDDPQEYKIEKGVLYHSTPLSQIQAGKFYLIKGYICGFKSLLIQKICIRCFKNIDDCSCQDKGNKKEVLIFHLEIDDGTGKIDCLFLNSVAERLVHTKIELIKQIIDNPDFKRFLDRQYSQLLGKDIYIKGKVEFWKILSRFIILIKNFREVDIDEELNEALKKLSNNMELHS